MLRLYFSAMVFVVFSHPVIAGESSDATEATPAPIMMQNGGAINGEISLDVGGQPVAAAYLPQTLGELRGAIIFLHDKSSQFDSRLLHQLREDLAAFGWDSLTVSLNYQTPDPADKPATSEATQTEKNENAAEPEADKSTETAEQTDADNPPSAPDTDESKSDEEAPSEKTALPGNPARLDAAIAWLQSKSPPQLIFVGHGAGVQTAFDAIVATPQPVSALVMINVGDSVTAEQIIDANLPVLDITGSRLDETSLEAAKMRRSKLKYNSTQTYSQRLIAGADRDFQGMESLLSKRVHSWLHRQLIADMRR